MNEKEKKGQAILKEALGDYELSFNEKYLPEEVEVFFSKKYQRNLNKILSGKQKKYPEFLNTAFKRVAVCMVVSIMLFGAYMTVKAIREPVIEFFTNVYDKFVEIFFDWKDVSGTPTEIETAYTLGYVPDGYELESREIVGTSVKTIFNNGEDNIILSQYPLTNVLTFDNENSNFQIIVMSDLEVAIAEKYNSKSLYWNDEKYAFNLTVPKEIVNDECVKIIESLTAKD